MKKILLLIISVALSASLFAQKATELPSDPAMVRHGRSLFLNDNKLNDYQVFQLIGDDIFNSTYLQARKQFYSGRGCVASACVFLAVGAAGIVYDHFGAQAAEAFDYDYSKYIAPRYSDDGKELPSYQNYVNWGSYAFMSLGCVLMNVGVPLLCVGKARLNWVANNYNMSQPVAYNCRTAGRFAEVNFTGCSGGYGAGLALRF